MDRVASVLSLYVVRVAINVDILVNVMDVVCAVKEVMNLMEQHVVCAVKEVMNLMEQQSVVRGILVVEKPLMGHAMQAIQVGYAQAHTRARA